MDTKSNISCILLSPHHVQRETRPTIDGIPHATDNDDGDADDGEDDVDVDDGDTDRDVMIRLTVSSRIMYHAY